MDKPEGNTTVVGRFFLAIMMFFLLFAFIFFVFPLFIIFSVGGYDSYRFDRSTLSWEQSDAVVMRSYAEKKTSRRSGRHSGMAGLSPSWCMYADYAYLVDGEIHSKKDVRVGCYYYKPIVDEKMKGYTEGSIIKIYVNPLKPNQSVLEAGVKFETKLIIFTSIACFMAGFLIVLGAGIGLKIIILSPGSAFLAAACVVAMFVSLISMALAETEIKGRGWQQTSGVITKSEVGLQKTWRGWCPVVEFEYTVKEFGRSAVYQGPEVHPGDWCRPKRVGAVLKAESYAVGSTVNVYYKKYHPSVSRLGGRPPSSAYVQYRVSLLIMIVAGFILWRKIKKWADETKPDTAPG